MLPANRHINLILETVGFNPNCRPENVAHNSALLQNLKRVNCIMEKNVHAVTDSRTILESRQWRH